MSEICSELMVRTSERYWRPHGVFIANFEQVNADWVTKECLVHALEMNHQSQENVYTHS